MKSISILFLAIAASFSEVKGQQAFNKTLIEQAEHHFVVNFSVPSEANIYQYRIEAGNDTTQMEVTGVVKPIGNSQLQRTYRYETFDTGYKYYRVTAVSMGSLSCHSQILCRPAAGASPEPKPGAPAHVATDVLAKGN